jgi:hypothetical protein
VVTGTGGAVALLLTARRQWPSERAQQHQEQVAAEKRAQQETIWRLAAQRALFERAALVVERPSEMSSRSDHSGNAHHHSARHPSWLRPLTRRPG